MFLERLRYVPKGIKKFRFLSLSLRLSAVYSSDLQLISSMTVSCFSHFEHLLFIVVRMSETRSCNSKSCDDLLIPSLYYLLEKHGVRFWALCYSACYGIKVLIYRMFYFIFSTVLTHWYMYSEGLCYCAIFLCKCLWDWFWMADFIVVVLNIIQTTKSFSHDFAFINFHAI